MVSDEEGESREVRLLPKGWRTPHLLPWLHAIRARFGPSRRTLGLMRRTRRSTRAVQVARVTKVVGELSIYANTFLESLTLFEQERLRATYDRLSQEYDRSGVPE